MKNWLYKIGVTECTRDDGTEVFDHTNAQSALEKADDAWEKKLREHIPENTRPNSELTEQGNEVRSYAMWGGFEAGMRVGARLLYQLLLEEGGVK